MNELGFWDYVTLGIALGIVFIFVAFRIRRALSATGGCGGCSGGCSPDTKEQGCGSASVSIDELKEKSIGQKQGKSN